MTDRHKNTDDLMAAVKILCDLKEVFQALDIVNPGYYVGACTYKFQRKK